MGPNVILFGWNRSIPGREQVGAAHFAEFTQYLGQLQGKGTIDGFDAVFLDPTGGNLNGFFLIKGDAGKLAELTANETYLAHIMRAGTHLDNVTHVRGVTGETLMAHMGLWTKITAG